MFHTLCCPPCTHLASGSVHTFSFHWTFFSTSEQQYWLEQEPQQKSGQDNGIRLSSPISLHGSPWAEAETHCSLCSIGQVLSIPPMTVTSLVQLPGTAEHVLGNLSRPPLLPSLCPLLEATARCSQRCPPSLGSLLVSW